MLLSCGLLFTALLLIVPAILESTTQNKPQVPNMPDDTASDFPLGTYLSWEMIASSSQMTGKDPWTFAADIMKTLKNHNIDTVWIVNISLDELQKLLKTTIPLGLKISPCLLEIEPRYRNWKSDYSKPENLEEPRAYYTAFIDQVIETLGPDIRGIRNWIMQDQPQGNDYYLINIIQDIFKQADPDHQAITVNNWIDFNEYIEKAECSPACICLYPFFGTDNPHGPHTCEASQNFYTVSLQNAVEKALRKGRDIWVTGQCFSLAKGPYDSDEKGRITVIPGGLVHWRFPSIPEVRWQVWEALRCGSRGFFFFSALCTAPPDVSAEPVQDQIFQTAIAKRKIKVGYASMLERTGSPTPQMQEIQRVYGAIRQLSPVLNRLSPSLVEWIQGRETMRTGSFVDVETDIPYCIVVNNDMKRTRRVKLPVAAAIKGIIDLRSGKTIELESMGWCGGNSTITVELPAGDGAVLQLIKR